MLWLAGGQSLCAEGLHGYYTLWAVRTIRISDNSCMNKVPQPHQTNKLTSLSLFDCVTPRKRVHMKKKKKIMAPKTKVGACQMWNDWDEYFRSHFQYMQPFTPPFSGTFPWQRVNSALIPLDHKPLLAVTFNSRFILHSDDWGHNPSVLLGDAAAM